MWAIRILSGPQSGESYPLKEGENFIGRNDNLDIKIVSSGVSKRHCKIKVEGNLITIIDLNSSNGTYVNGKLVQEASIQPGDKIAFHDVIVDLNYNVVPFAQPSKSLQVQNESPQIDFSQVAEPSNGEEQKVISPKSLKETLELYIENVVMPLLYRLIEQFEMKWVIASFVLVFIVMVSVLSTLPMVQITKSSIEKESQRRALTIARYIVDKNNALIQQGLTSSLSVQVARKEEGVKTAIIIDADSSRILAPASQAGSYENIPFVNLARAVDKYKDFEYVDTLINGDIGASVPIRVFDPSRNASVVKAYAVVIYDTNAISVDNEKTISLFMQIFIIACIFGLILYFFMIRIIEKPILQLNKDMDVAMKEGGQVNSPYVFPVMNNLLTNINSLISRTHDNSSSADYADNNVADRTFEAENIVRIISSPAITIKPDYTIIDCNQDFENLVDVSSATIRQQNIDALNDSSFILSITDLAERCQQQSNLILSNSIEFNGIPMEIHAQAINNASGIEYFLYVIKEIQGGEF